MKSFDGEVKGRIVEVRFALSGKIVKVNKLQGDKVAKWDLIASLDRKILQTELDRELADFEKVRADFEIFAGKVGDTPDEVTKYLKTEKQAQLNASVKTVELAKAKLDQSDLFSPVSGVVLDDGGITPGIFITPASAGIKILDAESLYFEIEIDQKEVGEFSAAKECSVDLGSGEEKISATSLPVFSDGKSFVVKIPLPVSPKIVLGMKGLVEFS